MRATEERLRSIVIDRLGVEDSEVSRDANFTEDLDADSLDIAFLVMDAEKEFGISIPDADAEDPHLRRGCGLYQSIPRLLRT